MSLQLILMLLSIKPVNFPSYIIMKRMVKGLW